MFKYLLVLTLISAAASLPAEARDRNGQISGGAGIGPAFEAPWASSAFRRPVGLGGRGTLFARYHQESSYGGFELALDYFRLSKQKLSSASITLHYFWRFMSEARMHPVVALGFGFSKVDNFFVTREMDSALFALRVGLEYELDPKTDIALHLDQLTIFRNQPADPNAHVLSPSIKFIRYFGSAPAPVVAEATPAAPAAAPAKDTDGDGVNDDLDKCPGTTKGVSVNELGCAVKQSFEIRLDVKFRSGTAELANSSDGQFAELAKILEDNDDLKVEIQGHTDSQGGKALNQRLSQSRAEVVRKLLIENHKVDGARLQAVGYGPSQPVDTNNNASGRANNRRVTAKVIR